MKLARQKSKPWILTQYLNTIYLGNGAYGVGAASQLYFGVPAVASVCGAGRDARRDHPVTRLLPDIRTGRAPGADRALALRAERHGDDGYPVTAAGSDAEVPQVQPQPATR